MSNKMTTIEKNSDSKTIIVGVKCKPKINAKSYCVLLFILYIIIHHIFLTKYLLIFLSKETRPKPKEEQKNSRKQLLTAFL